MCANFMNIECVQIICFMYYWLVIASFEWGQLVLGSLKCCLNFKPSSITNPFVFSERECKALIKHRRHNLLPQDFMWEWDYVVSKAFS